MAFDEKATNEEVNKIIKNILNEFYFISILFMHLFSTKNINFLSKLIFLVKVFFKMFIYFLF